MMAMARERGDGPDSLSVLVIELLAVNLAGLPVELEADWLRTTMWLISLSRDVPRQQVWMALVTTKSSTYLRSLGYRTHPDAGSIARLTRELGAIRREWDVWKVAHAPETAATPTRPA
jgi:hypothetical protein